ncbi:MAG: methylated-DNA--[protein]-cysteine S-methyltransferase [Thermoleophilia bacterium]
MTDTVVDRLRGWTPDLDTARTRLLEAALREGVVDAMYRTVDSPLGALLVGATPAGLVRLAFATEDHDEVLEDLARRLGTRILLAHGRLDPAARELDAYFGGGLREFTVPVDLRLATGFRREVLDELRAVPYGATCSYTALAAAAGRPRAVRAAGSACATNPVPIVVPCHRVLRSDGSLGGYAGGLDVKRRLLDLEAAA